MYALIYTTSRIRVAPKFLAHFSSGSVDGDTTSIISYLTNSCGLSSKDALPASKKLSIRSRQKWDAVLELLINYGFTDAQISSLVAKWPLVLQSSAAETLSPKLQFFNSIGVPPALVSQKISEYPRLLARSSGNYYTPWCSYLKSIVQSERNIVTVFSRSPKAFAQGWPKHVPSNIQILRERGVPECSIALLLVNKPSMMISSKETFTAFVDRAVQMGFDKSKTAFVSALEVFGKMSDSTLKHKMDVYRRCGWSESDLTSAFLSHPACLKFSEKKITSTMDFLVKKVGMKPADVARYPVILGYSVDRRMRPRWIIAGILKAKGLMRESTGITNLLMMSEANFLKKHISDHEGNIPQLMDIYLGKMK